MKLSGFINTALKGFGMGAANVVPGVSGGTIALLTGIYGNIVDAISSLTDRQTWQALFKGRLAEFWKLVNGNFLVALAVGILVSVFTLAKLMTFVLANYPILTWAFFFGLILASAFVMFRGIKGWGVREVVFTFLGAVLGVLVCTLSPTQTPDNALFIFICGAVSICTMILPGVSGSFVLLILGKYDYIMEAIGSLDWMTLVYFGLGCAVGILAFARFLHWLLARWEKQTMLVLLGFVLGSLVKVWPWQETVPGADLHIGGAILWCVLGIALVAVLEIFGSKAGKQ